MEQEIIFRKKRETGQVISDSFEFIKQNKADIFRIIAIYVLPFMLLYAGAQIYFQRNILSQLDLTNQDPEALMKSIEPLYKNLFVYLLFGLFVQSLLAGTYYTYLDACAKQGKEKFRIQDISPKFFANSSMALGANLVFSVIIFFGILPCFLPAIFFANTFSLVVFICISERQGVYNALGTSWKLVIRAWLNTFLVNVFAYIIVLIPNIIFTFIGPSIFLKDVAGATDILSYPLSYWIAMGILTVITTSLLIIPYTFQAFQYFNLQERINPSQSEETEIEN